MATAGLTVVAALLMTSVLAAEDADGDPRLFTQQDLLSEFHEGWEAAGRLVGLDTSQGLGALVSASLLPGAPAANKQDTGAPAGQPSPSLFHGFFRLLGFDSTRLNAIAINAVVFIAKMIGSSLIRNWTSGGAAGGRSLTDEEMPEGSPLSWVLEDVKDKARGMLARAQSEDLGDQLISALQSVPGETDCVQVLVCRASPFLATMRRSLRTLLGTEPYPAPWAALSPLQRMLHFLPSRQELMDAADTCRQRLPSCGQLFAGFGGLQ